MHVFSNENMAVSIILLLLIGVGDRFVSAQTAAEVKTLRTNLMTSYNKDVLPRNDQTTAVIVTISLDLLSINSFDMISQKLSVTGFLTVSWTDDFLTWDSATNGGITDLSFPQNTIWKPDLALQNSFKKIEELGDAFIYASVDHLGNVVWQPFEVFETNCDADITYFPFDRQSCQILLITWSFSDDKVIVKKDTSGIGTDDIETNSEWNIEQTKASDQHVTSQNSEVVFTLIMRRKPLFPIMNIIIPVILMVAMNMFVMVLPAESGEKVGFAVTIMLALAVFLTIVSSSIPSNSVSVSLLAVYLLIIQIISGVTLVFTVKNMQIYHRNPDVNPVSRSYCKIVHLVNKIRCRGRQYTARVAPEVEIENERQEMARPIANPDDITWPEVTETLDFLFFWVFIVIFVIATIIIVALTIAQPPLTKTAEEVVEEYNYEDPDYGFTTTPTP